MLKIDIAVEKHGHIPEPKHKDINFIKEFCPRKCNNAKTLTHALEKQPLQHT